MNQLKNTSGRFSHLRRRITMLVIGMEFATFGISLTAVSNIGTTPISTLPYVLSKIFPLSFGTTTFILNVIFVVLQALLLRSRFSILNLLQIPAVLVFSAFIDLNMHLLQPYSPNNWWLSAALSMFGNLVLAVGIILQVRSKTIVQPGEGIVLAFAAVFHRPFGTVKIVNDTVLVVIAAILSFAVLGSFVGLREGTAVSAVLVGFLVKAITAFFPDQRSEKPHQVNIRHE